MGFYGLIWYFLGYNGKIDAKLPTVKQKTRKYSSDKRFLFKGLSEIYGIEIYILLKSSHLLHIFAQYAIFC